MIYIHKTSNGYFQSLARAIQYQLNVLNVACEITDDLSKEGIWILNYYSYKSEIVKNQFIALQTEPDIRKHKPYKEWLSKAVEVWDYSSNFQIGYSPIWELEKEEVKDIDVLFFGSINERRMEILRTIPKVTIVQGIFGPRLDHILIKTKILLSLYYVDGIDNDMSRLAPLLSKQVFVICEESKDPKFDFLKQYIVTCKKEELKDQVQFYLDRPFKRIEWIQKGYNFIKNNYKFDFQSKIIKSNYDTIV
jgi:hypothetical protein